MNVGYQEKAIEYEDQRGRKRYQPAVTILHPLKGVRTLLRWWSIDITGGYAYWAKDSRRGWDSPMLVSERSAMKQGRRKIRKLRSVYRKVEE